MTCKIVYPNPALRHYISKYYILSIDDGIDDERKQFADGCMDLLINIGSGVPVINGTTRLSPGKIYLIGILDSYFSIGEARGSAFLGIQFKPGGFLPFYQIPLTEFSGRIIEFHDPELGLIIDMDAGLFSRLDFYFLNRLAGNNPLLPILDEVQKCQGQVTATSLSEKFYLSERSLLRHFCNRIGMSPKEYIKIVRYKSALSKLLEPKVKSLSDLAIMSGYYDQSHMFRDIKQFTGLSPSMINSLGNESAEFLRQWFEIE